MQWIDPHEISKRDLVKIRNAVAAIFYIENSSAADMSRNWKELVNLLKVVLEKDGIEIIRAIMDRIYQIHELPANSRTTCISEFSASQSFKFATKAT